MVTSEEKGKENKDIVWKIPTLDSYAVPQKKTDFYQTSISTCFQLQVSNFLTKYALSLSCSLTCFYFAFFMNNCLSSQYCTQQVSCFQQKVGNKKLPFMGKSFLKKGPSHWHKSTKSKCIHLTIQKVLICHHVMYSIWLL